MPLQLDDLDVAIAARVRPGYRREPLPKRRPYRIGAVDVLATVALVVVLFYFWFNTAVIILGMVVASLVIWALTRLYEGKPPSADTLTTASELLAVAEQAPISRAEAAYCRVAGCLADGLPGMDPHQRRTLLHQIGDLIRQSRELRTVDAQLEQILRTDSIYRLGEERRQLEERRDGTADPQLRATLDQALALNAERLANAEVFASTAERLAAQEEVIAQALASVYSTLVRPRLASADAGTTSDALRGVAEIVERANAQTRAVEQAVAEVVALRAGGL